MSDRATRSRSFETVAAEYERSRPEYPEEALRWAAGQIGLEEQARVLDIGAGTGKLTRGLVALGFEVVAVEPGAPMLAQLREVVPEAEAHEAPAEAIPLPDQSVDAAFAGQAYHWFDRERAVPELHRVVRRGLALLWNWWDERDPLQHELGPIVGYAGHQPYWDEALPREPWFRELGRTVVESVWESSPEALVAYISTTSAVVTMEAEERDQRLAEVREIAFRYGEQFSLPRITFAFAFERLS
ncbi:MAG TPA: class I SAM-dependent methyltransferase [Gaiellaceae bacterium]|nr:class I SAM-dependent methyltransferase [Gaiellaceae bacterium]